LVCRYRPFGPYLKFAADKVPCADLEVAKMFNPEMMKAAQQMMSNMKPEEMQRMSQMAAGMDPSVMDNMMKNMGGSMPGGGMPAGMDSKQMQDQMKQMGSMSPEQLQSQMSQAQKQMSDQKQYYFNASTMLKNEGNTHIKNEKYDEALKVYSKGLENIVPHSGDDIEQLRLSLLLNMAMCTLKKKEWTQTVDHCEAALKVNTKSVKALFRRGLARFELGQLADAITDVKLSSKLSPDDKTISAELIRVEKECTSKGLSKKDMEAAEKKATELASAKSTSGGSSSSSAPAFGGQNVNEAFDKLSQNPDMLSEATQAMKNMSPEQLDLMMKNAPLPPGVDAAEARKRMEAVRENPALLSQAMEHMKGMSEEDRKNMMKGSMPTGSSTSMAASSGGGQMPDMNAVSSMMENPDMMKQMAEMAKSSGAAGPEADMMSKMAEMMSSNPEMGKMMSNMMKGMDPDAMQKMMEMRQNGGGQGMGEGTGDPMADMMNSPDMMKAAEDMMKNMSPEMLTSMAKSSGMDLDEGQAKMLTRLMPLMPYAMKAYRAFGYVKRGCKAMFSPKGRIVLAVVIVGIAMTQHYGMPFTSVRTPDEGAPKQEL